MWKIIQQLYEDEREVQEEVRQLILGNDQKPPSFALSLQKTTSRDCGDSCAED